MENKTKKMLLTSTNIPLTLRPQHRVGVGGTAARDSTEEDGGRGSSWVLPPKPGPHLPGSHTQQPTRPLVAKPHFWSPSLLLSISCPQFSQTPDLLILPPDIYQCISHLHPTTPHPHSESPHCPHSQHDSLPKHHSHQVVQDPP